jgi:hypothetical protein
MFASVSRSMWKRIVGGSASTRVPEHRTKHATTEKNSRGILEGTRFMTSEIAAESPVPVRRVPAEPSASGGRQSMNRAVGWFRDSPVGGDPALAFESLEGQMRTLIDRASFDSCWIRARSPTRALLGGDGAQDQGRGSLGRVRRFLMVALVIDKR